MKAFGIAKNWEPKVSHSSQWVPKWTMKCYSPVGVSIFDDVCINERPMLPHHIKGVTYGGVPSEYFIAGEIKVSFTRTVDNKIFQAINQIIVSNSNGERWICRDINSIQQTMAEGMTTWVFRFQFCEFSAPSSLNAEPKWEPIKTWMKEITKEYTL